MNCYGLVKEQVTPPAGGAAGSSTEAGALDKKPVDANKTKVIAQLSPTYKILSKESFGKAQGIALTSTIDADGQGWLYVIR
jgi:hypothetical protein